MPPGCPRGPRGRRALALSDLPFPLGIILSPGTEGQVGGIVTRARDAALKVLICCDSEILLQMAGMALEASGHQVVLEREPSRLVAQAGNAQALLVDVTRAKQAPALLRDRGFTGRALLLGDAAPEELAKQSRDLGL